MKIAKLRVRALRCLDEIELVAGPSLNWLVGPNGSGKTSLLEAIYLLSHGHSFRSGALDTLIQRGCEGFTVFAEIHGGDRNHILGMARSDNGWKLHIDGQDAATLSAVLRHCAAMCFEPGSQKLIAGPAEGRRRFLDWGVFHVEHRSLDHWREYRRVLRQRNALLRASGAAEQLEIWEAELERLAAPIQRQRQDYIESWQGHLWQVVERLVPELGAPHVHYYAGWDSNRSLGSILAEQREGDIRRGHTRSGPHRADWKLTFLRAPIRDHLSRGQIKLTALACVLAQGSLFSSRAQAWPILCLDDLDSELDLPHRQLVFREILSSGAQAWITTTEPPNWRASSANKVFHVEHGRASGI